MQLKTVTSEGVLGTRKPTISSHAREFAKIQVQIQKKTQKELSNFTFSIGTPFVLAQMVRGIKRGQHPLQQIHSKLKIKSKTGNVNSLIKATKLFKVVPQILNCYALGKELFSSIVESQDILRSLLGKQRHFHPHLNCSLPQPLSQSLNSFHCQIPPPDTCITYLSKLNQSSEANSYPGKFEGKRMKKMRKMVTSLIRNIVAARAI